MIPTQIPRRTSAHLLTRRAVLVGLLLSLALVVGPPLRTVQAGEAPGEPQVLKTLNQSDGHGHGEGDDHEDATPTPEPAHDDDDGHHDATPTPEPAHDDDDGHHDVTPSPVWDDAQTVQPMQPTPTSAPVQVPTQQPHDDDAGHHTTPVPTERHDNDDGHHGTPVPADNHGTSGDSPGADGHADGATGGHDEGAGHSEGEGEGHGRAVPPPDPTTKKIVLGSFAVFNLGVLIVAAVLKRRMPQRTPRPVRPS